MSPIIRAPAISSKMRKLTNRSARVQDAPEVHSHARPATSAHTAGSPGAHGSHGTHSVHGAHGMHATRLSHPSHTASSAVSVPPAVAMPRAQAPVQPQPQPQSQLPPAVPPISAPAPEVQAAPDLEALVAQARQTVLLQIKQEAESVRELARQRGLQEGRQAGIEEAKKEFASELVRIRSLAGNLQQALSSQFQGVEDVMVEIAFAAICKILGQTAFTQEGIRSLVRQASADMLRLERIVVRLHPADLAALRSSALLDSVLSNASQISWLADNGVQMGGCLLETERGDLDARLETQIARLREVLVAARGS